MVRPDSERSGHDRIRYGMIPNELLGASLLMITGSRRICAIDSSCRCARATSCMSAGRSVLRDRTIAILLSGTMSATVAQRR